MIPGLACGVASAATFPTRKGGKAPLSPPQPPAAPPKPPPAPFVPPPMCRFMRRGGGGGGGARSASGSVGVNGGGDGWGGLSVSDGVSGVGGGGRVVSDGAGNRVSNGGGSGAGDAGVSDIDRDGGTSVDSLRDGGVMHYKQTVRNRYLGGGRESVSAWQWTRDCCILDVALSDGAPCVTW
jgi:hypothetical protein